MAQRAPSQLNRAQLKQWIQVSRRYLVELVTVNPTLKLFSLVLAILMWSFVASQKSGDSTEIQFITPLVLKNIPASLEVMYAPVQSVSVLVHVRRSLTNSINPNQFQVAIDLSNQLSGAVDYPLSVRNINYNNQRVPAGIDVLQISPSIIPLTLEETIQKAVSIQPRFVGDPAPGYIISSIQVLPSEVQVQGPRSVLGPLIQVPTRPLDMENLNGPVDLLVTLDLPPQVRLAGNEVPFIQARVEVSNNPTRVLLRDIPVRFVNERLVYKTSTRTISVHLEGPRSVMDGLNVAEVSAEVDLAKYPPGDYRGLSPKVITPETVKVLEQWPILDLYVINREILQKSTPVPKDKQSGSKVPMSKTSKLKE